jgi:hypothetical protein
MLENLLCFCRHFFEFVFLVPFFCYL